MADVTEIPVEVTPRSIPVREIFEFKKETLQLELLNEGVDLERMASDPDVSSPGLALAGYTARTPEGRMWVFGETEMTYLDSLSPEGATERLSTLFTFDTPAVFITKGQPVSSDLLELATKHGIPVIRSGKSTKEFYRRIKPYLEEVMAPTTTLHGSLADVYGVGLLFMGESGIGKSECVLDLVERGHRLVADDLVLASRQGNDLVIGRGHELQRHHMELRGVGLIDIAALFGIRAIRQQKRIEVIVQLELWDHGRVYSRTGLEYETKKILGVPLPCITVPLNPGKNITVISEVVAMNHLLKYAGVHPARAFNRELKDRMRPIREYLEQDYE